MSDFNPRSREGSDVQHLRRLLSCSEFQSTLPRRERRHTHVSSVSNITISIHAPAKGATYRTYNVIHYSQHFNPRSREGSDGRPMRQEVYLVTFQSTLPRRERRPPILMTCSAFLFQSTLPRRERPSSIVQLASGSNFNPRSREGSDAAHIRHLNHQPISIHAPAKGATSSVQPPVFQCTDFNPRSREGSDDIPPPSPAADTWISIHAPAKGATAKITKTIPNDFGKINNYNNSFA